jgi:D-alanyl-lipoteichoic acid acyltransferase DltB (MBOAT superfamily)
MIFSSADFIFYFLPAVLCAFWLVRLISPAASIAVLCAASMGFYAYWKWQYAFLFSGSIALNYVCYLLIRNSGKAAIVKAGVIGNLALIGVFKYANFFVSDVAGLTQYQSYVENIVLPLGISFFTFQQISFLVDSARQRETEKVPFLHYIAYISFFPQLIAGPIVRHDEFLYQLNQKLTLKDNFVRGCLLFGIGLAKKVLIADTLSVYVATGFADPSALSTLDAWALTFLYTFQLYFDFSGYSDMAIGIGLMFGLQLPQNFNSPYQAASIQDFWRRWHMTLSRWLRDYLYIPLGGSKNGEMRAYSALLATMFLGGLWHGAGWTFVVWGAAHGVALALNRAWSRAGYKMPAAAGWFVTFLFVSNLWVVFRAETFDAAWAVYAAMWSPSSLLDPPAMAHAVFQPQLWVALAGLIIVVTMLPNSWGIDRYCKVHQKSVFVTASQFAAGFIFMLAIKRMSEASAPSEFIYFQF